MSDEFISSNIIDFSKCVDKKRIGESVYMIDCKLGLCGAKGITQESVLAEAFHYWRQYKDDGEYSSIIGGKSVIEKLINKVDKQ